MVVRPVEDRNSSARIRSCQRASEYRRRWPRHGLVGVACETDPRHGAVNPRRGPVVAREPGAAQIGTADRVRRRPWLSHPPALLGPARLQLSHLLRRAVGAGVVWQRTRFLRIWACAGIRSRPGGGAISERDPRAVVPLPRRPRARVRILVGVVRRIYVGSAISYLRLASSHSAAGG